MCGEEKSEAGNNKSSYFSSFKRTCRNIILYVKNNPGNTVGNIIKNISHHYGSTSTARRCILKWTQEGVIKGIELKYIKGKYLFYIKKENKNGI